MFSIPDSHGGFVYEASNSEVRTWTAAERYCQNRGGHLASITSEEENTLLTTFATEQYSCGIKYDAKLVILLLLDIDGWQSLFNHAEIQYSSYIVC